MPRTAPFNELAERVTILRASCASVVRSPEPHRGWRVDHAAITAWFLHRQLVDVEEVFRHQDAVESADFDHATKLRCAVVLREASVTTNNALRRRINRDQARFLATWKAELDELLLEVLRLSTS